MNWATIKEPISNAISRDRDASHRQQVSAKGDRHEGPAFSLAGWSPRRKSYVLITVLFSILAPSLLVFMAGGRQIWAEIKARETAAPERARSADQAAAKKEARFAIYLVKNPTNEHSIDAMALKELVLEEKPILTEEDIASYRISPDGRHFIRLKPGVKVRVAPPEGHVLLDRGFVVIADGNRIYLGDFHAPISSWLPNTAWVRLPLSRPGEAAELQIDIKIDTSPMLGFPGLPLFKDLRADPRILKALQEIGKLDTEPIPDGWGESYQGVKVRLAADKPKWKQGDEPRFKVEVLNVGNTALQILIGPRVLYVDATWFESAADEHLRPLDPGGRHESIVILKPEIWRSRVELLHLKPGKHEIRVSYDLLGSPYDMDLRLLSNPVEIEILPGEELRHHKGIRPVIPSSGDVDRNR